VFETCCCRQDLRISYRTEIERSAEKHFLRRELEPVHLELDRLHSSVRSSRLFVPRTCMPATAMYTPISR